jgi:hypothetical protein
MIALLDLLHLMFLLMFLLHRKHHHLSRVLAYKKVFKSQKKYTDGTIRYGLFSSTGEPHNLLVALNDSNWCAAM